MEIESTACKKQEAVLLTLYTSGRSINRTPSPHGDSVQSSRNQNTSGRSISRILSSTTCLGDHLSGRHVATPLDAAYPGLAPSRWRVHIWRRAISRRPRTTSSLLGLAPGGGYLATHITARAGGLLHHLFTLTTLTPSPLPGEEGSQGERATCFCGPFRQVHASRRFPRPGCYPTPCSMECGLSSTPTTQSRDRPTDLRCFHDTFIVLRRQISQRNANERVFTCNFKEKTVKYICEIH